MAEVLALLQLEKVLTPNEVMKIDLLVLSLGFPLGLPVKGASSFLSVQLMSLLRVRVLALLRSPVTPWLVVMLNIFQG